MKQKVTFVVVVAIVALLLVAIIALKGLSPKATTANMLIDENVEALTTGESGGKAKTCYNTITSKDGSMVRYCPTCTFVSGTDTWYAPSRTCVK